MIYFGTASNSTTGATQILDVTPPASMVRGQAVIIYAQSDSNPAGTKTISNTGGQEWTNIYDSTGVSAGFSIWWCKFNGVWSANPSVDFGAVTPDLTAASVIMHVFTATANRYRWMFESFHTYATSGNVVCTIGDTSISNVRTLALCSWITSDVNTWGNLTATWTVTGAAEYTVSGSGQSSTYAHKFFTSSGTSGAISKEQLTNGPDNSLQTIIVFAEIYKQQILN